MPTPPLWVLRQTILPYGARLMKNRPKWEPPMYIPPARGRMLPGRTIWKETDGKWYRWDHAAGEKVEVKENFQSVATGNLDKGEYFLWVGRKEPTFQFANCRACGYLAFTLEDRRNHKNGCGKLLFHAYKKLQADRDNAGNYKCAICNNPTANLSWSVPICPGCMETWMFGRPGTNAIPGMLETALELVRAEGAHL